MSMRLERRERESNRVDFFPTKCRIPLSTNATRLTAALDSLKLELQPQPVQLTSNDNTYRSALYRAVQSLKSLIESAIATAAEKIASLLAPTKDTPEPADGASLPRVIETNSNNNNDISPRVSKVRGCYNVGTSLIKYWEGIPYTGKITSNTGQYYKVKYDDNDEEELTHREVTKYVQQANSITYTNGWSHAYKALVQEEEYRFQKAFNAVCEFEDKSHTLIQASHWSIEIYAKTHNSSRFGTSQVLMTLDA
jgi:hypothetical protein